MWKEREQGPSNENQFKSNEVVDRFTDWYIIKMEIMSKPYDKHEMKMLI